MINQEEYEVLKSYISEEKYIAKDRDGSIRLLTDYPERDMKREGWSDGWGKSTLKNSANNFQFIQWEDEEPYEIAELIREYEIKGLQLVPSGRAIVDSFDESEETEVKCTENIIEFISFSINSIEEKLPKMNREKSEGRKEWHEGYLTAMKEVKNKLYQLDEPEVLSQELPEIPKFVADYIEECKRLGKSLYAAIDSMPNKVSEWMTFDIRGFGKGQELFARAWLDGFRVEEEPLYYAKIKGYELVNDREDVYWNVDRKELYIDNNWHDYSGYKTTKLTRYDWNNLGVNENNADFVEVEELE